MRKFLIILSLLLWSISFSQASEADPLDVNPFDRFTKPQSEPSAPLQQQEIPSEKKEQKEKATSQPDPAEKFAGFILEGIKLEDSSDYSGAAKLYSQAVELQPESPIALIRRAVCYARTAHHAEAASDLQLAVQQRPRTISDFAALSWLHSTSPLEPFRDGAVAVAYAQRVLKDSETAEHYDLLAAAYAEMGNFQKARETIEVGLKYFPDSPRASAMKDRYNLYKEKKKYREDWSPISEDLEQL